MDEYNQGWDPELRHFFKKIMNSFVLGATWLMMVAVAGLFFKLAIVKDGWRWYNVAFYGCASLTFLLVLFYLYRVWGRKDKPHF